MVLNRRAASASATENAGTNTLLVAPWSATHEGAAAMAASARGVIEEARVLLVTFRRPAAACSACWRETVSDPETLVVIAAGVDGDAARHHDRTAPTDEIRITEEHVDPTWVGSHAKKWLRRWDDGDGVPVVHVEGLDVLVDQVGTGTAFRFFHLLVSRVRRMGAVGHHHLDPSGCPEPALERFARACETVRVYDGDHGDWV